MNKTIKVTRCPTAYAVPCSGETSKEDQEALARHHEEREANYKLCWFGPVFPSDLESMLNG